MAPKTVHNTASSERTVDLFCQQQDCRNRLGYVCRHVLNNRSDHCRARHDSGMRDAADSELHVPEHFSKVGVFDQDLAAVSSANAPFAKSRLYIAASLDCLCHVANW